MKPTPDRTAPGTIAGLRIAILCATAFALQPYSALAQEPEDRSCVLVLEPTESTRSQSRRVGPELYVTHIGGGMRWTCGNARMVADSAIRHDREERLVMIGDVDYRDSVRTLTSERLTYFEPENRLLAERDVVLTRLASGSVLRGPRVVFFRSVAGGTRRTVATGRPWLTLPPEDDREPAEVHADSLVMVGDEVARAWGEVVIERPNMVATADSAFFRLAEGEGDLHGSPVVTGEEFRLAGDTIRTQFADGELRSVEAQGEAQAEGEEYELFSERIHGRLADETIETIRAVGPEPSVAISVPYRLSGDSLSFAFADGALDSLVAVGRATAVEIEQRPEDPLREVALTASGERSWVTGDTLYLVMATARDTPAAAGEDSLPDAERQIDHIRSVGEARAYYVLGTEYEEASGAGSPEDRPAGRNYLVGREIRILFEEGSVSRVLGRDAIGIFLDDEEEGT